MLGFLCPGCGTLDGFEPPFPVLEIPEIFCIRCKTIRQPVNLKANGGM